MAQVDGPKNFQPDSTLGERQWSYLTGAATYVLIEGSGIVWSVQTGVAGGAGATAEIYDARTGDTPAASNRVAIVLLTSATAIRFGGGLKLDRGLTVILTSGATVEATISYNGKSSVSTRTFP